MDHLEPGPGLIRTASLREAHGKSAETLANRWICAFSGHSGLGKTHAIEYWLPRLQSSPHVTIEYRETQTERGLLGKLYSKITGEPDRGTGAALFDRVVKACKTQGLPIVVDEAQRLSIKSIDLLRQVHHHSGEAAAIFLVGDERLVGHVKRRPALARRIRRHVRFRPVTLAELRAELPYFHDLFEDTDDEVIRFVHDTFAHGNLAAWKNFTEEAEALCTSAGARAITLPIAQKAIAQAPEFHPDVFDR